MAHAERRCDAMASDNWLGFPIKRYSAPHSEAVACPVIRLFHHTMTPSRRSQTTIWMAWWGEWCPYAVPSAPRRVPATQLCGFKRMLTGLLSIAKPSRCADASADEHMVIGAPRQAADIVVR
jgi:hypothetical protein